MTVFGGSGFIGRYIVKRLAGEGWRIRVAVRHPDNALFLKPFGNIGQISVVQANVRNPSSVAAALVGSDAAVNAVGILYEKGVQQFSALHVEAAKSIAMHAREAGATQLVHISAIGAAADSLSQYAASKAAGEQAVRAAFPQATILRPSVVFGAEDDFLNRFAAMARVAPALPLINGGRTRFQPVYVGDIAEAVVHVLDRSESAGKIYELGGPNVLSFKQLLEYVRQWTGRRPCLLPLPSVFARALAFVGGFLPRPPLTLDQLRLLAEDNVVAVGTAGLADLEITPTPMDAIVPDYLARYRRPGLRK